MQIKPHFIGRPDPRARRGTRNLRGVRGWRGRSASETLEMAFALPLLLLLAFGTVEFGVWFYIEHNFQSAAREAARAACVAPIGSDADRQATALSVATQVMGNLNFAPDKYMVSSSFTDPDSEGVRYIVVTIEADWSEIGVETGLFLKLRHGSGETEFVDEATKIRGSATMRIES